MFTFKIMFIFKNKYCFHLKYIVLKKKYILHEQIYIFNLSKIDEFLVAYRKKVCHEHASYRVGDESVK